MDIQPPLFIQILADRHLNPGAAMLHFGQDDLNAFLPLLQDTLLTGLSKNFPCLIDKHSTNTLSQELSTAFQDAGCSFVPRELVQHTDEQTKPVLEDTTQWLSGNWYLAPPPKKSHSQTASRILSMKLLQLVAADADNCEIESIFRQDPVLAYHLLRLVNSLGVGVGRHIASFSQAILILGRQQLKRWLNLMLFAANRDDYRCNMLLARVTIRARIMELLAQAAGHDRSVQEQAFMAGMFSLLGTLFGLSLEEVINPLNLGEALSGAVLRHEGEIGFLLRATEKMEQTDDSGRDELLARVNLTSAACNQLILQAHAWMLAVIHETQDDVDA